MISQERLKELMSYDPYTGLFKWKVRTSLRVQIGDIVGGAGRPRKCKYFGTRIDGRRVRLHQLAVLYMTGTWPKNVPDHRDGNGQNNRWDNIRDISLAENSQNIKGPRRSSSTGLLGAYRCTNGYYKFQSQITAYGKRVHIGFFNTAEEAHKAYMKKRRELQGGNLL